MDAISLQAYAKINLGLDVLRKREDGYHEVKMIMQSISLADTLVLRKIPEPVIRLRPAGEIKQDDLPMDESNLIYKAIHLLREEYKIAEGVEAVLTKRIPIAAGMAGGSSDAAAAFRGMNRLFQLNLSVRQLCDRGVTLGADIPYCIMGGTALAEGIGERLTPLDKMPDCWILVAKPPISVSTAFVYGNLNLRDQTEHPDIDGIQKAIAAKNLYAIADRLGNLLECVTIPSYPVIEQIKDAMREHGALQALMSGSGPTVFGLYDNKQTAEEAGEMIRRAKWSDQIYVTQPVERI